MVYAQRDSLLATDDVSETITDFCAEVVSTLINQFVPPESLEELGCEGGWLANSLCAPLKSTFYCPF